MPGSVLTKAFVLLSRLSSHVDCPFPSLFQRTDEFEDSLILQADLRARAICQPALWRGSNLQGQEVRAEVRLLELGGQDGRQGDRERLEAGLGSIALGVGNEDQLSSRPFMLTLARRCMMCSRRTRWSVSHNRPTSFSLFPPPEPPAADEPVGGESGIMSVTSAPPSTVRIVNS